MNSHASIKKIKGFHILKDGTLVKIHENLDVEIVSGSSKNVIKITDKSLADNTAFLETRIVELPDQKLALAYCDPYTFEPDQLIIIDLKNYTVIAREYFTNINSLSLLNDNSLLINSELICSLEDDRLILHRDERFNDVSMQFNRHKTIYKNLAELKGIYIPLPNKTGFIYFDNHHQSTLRLLSNEFKPIKKLRLCKSDCK